MSRRDGSESGGTEAARDDSGGTTKGLRTSGGRKQGWEGQSHEGVSKRTEASRWGQHGPLRKASKAVQKRSDGRKQAAFQGCVLLGKELYRDSHDHQQTESREEMKARSRERSH